jgi:hypothetical protein
MLFFETKSHPQAENSGCITIDIETLIELGIRTLATYPTYPT